MGDIYVVLSALIPYCFVFSLFFVFFHVMFFFLLLFSARAMGGSSSSRERLERQPDPHHAEQSSNNRLSHNNAVTSQNSAGGVGGQKGKPFEPEINSMSLRLVKQRQQLMGTARGTAGTVNQLYARAADTECKLEQKRRQAEEEAMEECTFKPVVTHYIILYSVPLHL